MLKVLAVEDVTVGTRHTVIRIAVSHDNIDVPCAMLRDAVQRETEELTFWG